MCFKQREMTLRQRLSLSTWEKWRRFGRIPWKFIFAVLLIICTTSIVILQSLDESPYTRANLATWQYLLSPEDDISYTGAMEQYGFESVWYLYRISTFLKSLNKTMNVYYNVHNLTIDRYEYISQNITIEKPPYYKIIPKNMTLQVERYVQGYKIFNLDLDFDDSTTTDVFSLSNNDLGPFNQNFTNLKHYIHAMKAASLGFQLQNYEFHSTYRTCFLWDISVVYSFTFRGRIDMSVKMDQTLCPQEKYVSWYERTDSVVVFLYFFTAIFALASQGLHIKAVIRAIQIFQQVKRAAFQSNQFGGESPLEPLTPATIHRRMSWHHLGWRDKLKFFNMWFFTASIGNICNIISASMSLSGLAELSSSNYSKWLAIITGLGCMLSWISLVQYFESTTSYYVLITTLTTGTPRVARFLVGVMPVFLGYAMFGVAMFSSTTPRFATVDQACVTLFALLNGDVIHDVFDELYPAQPIISRIYLYTFISLFIYAVLNIFIAIVEDAFFASKAFQKQQQKTMDEIGLEKMDPLDLVDMVMPPDDSSSSEDESTALLSNQSNQSSIIRASAKKTEKKTKSKTKKPKKKKSNAQRSTTQPTSSTPLLAQQQEDATIAILPEETNLVRTKSHSIDSSLKITIELIKELQNIMNREFIDYINTLIEEKQTKLRKLSIGGAGEEREMMEMQNAEQIILRPPHLSTYYPCMDSSCLYCSIRRIYEESAELVKTQFPDILNRLVLPESSLEGSMYPKLDSTKSNMSHKSSLSRKSNIIRRDRSVHFDVDDVIAIDQNMDQKTN